MLQVYLVIGLLHCMLVTMMFEFIADKKAKNKSYGHDNRYDDMVNIVLGRISNGDIVVISAFVGTTILIWPLHAIIYIIVACKALRRSK